MLWSSVRPVDRANHRFIGFPDADIDGMFASGIRTSDAAPEIVVHRDARVLPCDPGAPDPWSAGGILTADGDLIPLVRDWTEHIQTVLGLREPAAAEPVETVDGDVLYLGWLMENFGHLLTESLARVWALRFVPETTPVLFHYWPGRELPASALRMLELFGIARERIIVPQRPAIYRSLLIPDPLMLLNTVAHERAGDPYREVAGRIAGGGAPSGRPLYLSRTALPASQRAIAGEAALEDLLRDNGFIIAHPELMSIAEQIRLVARHRTIVVGAGSACQLLLFAHPGTRMHLLGHLPLLPAHVITCEAAGLRSVCHNVLRWRLNPFNAVRLDVRAAAANLAGDGLLPNLARLPYLPSEPELDAEFDEAWLFGLFTGVIRMNDAVLAEAYRLIERLPPSAWPAFAAIAASMPPGRMTAREADAMMARFAAALMDEPDPRRRFRFAAPVRALSALALAGCTPETQALAAAAIGLRLPQPA